MKTLIDYAMSYLGTPYQWGGESYNGIDCSGFIRQIFKSIGLTPKPDLTAHGLYLHFKDQGDPIFQPKKGALVFYGNEKTVKHVAFCLDDIRVIEAGGGVSTTKTREDAIKHNAWVRIRPYNHRSDLLDVIMPLYPSWMKGVD